MMKKWGIKAAFVACVASIALSGSLAAAETETLPSVPEKGMFKVGVQPWLGYGLWHIAAAKGFYEQAGLTGVEIINFNEDKDINAALASGQLDGASIATHTAIGMVEAGLPVRIISLQDVSLTADAIVASQGISSIVALKGKPVAYEEGTTSDILLNYALAKNGMSIADIERVPMPASDAGSALIAGRVPVAVTYEPYISGALIQDKTMRVLFTAGEAPGLISDVFVVREDVLKKRPGQVLAMLKAWDASLAFYRENTKEGRAIIAKAIGASPGELTTAFDGVQYYSGAESAQAFAGDFTTKIYGDVIKAAMQAKLISKDVKPTDVIDDRFVKALSQ